MNRLILGCLLLLGSGCAIIPRYDLNEANYCRKVRGQVTCPDYGGSNGYYYIKDNARRTGEDDNYYRTYPY